MAEKWHDINAPGVWQKPNKDTAKSGTAQPADAADAADDAPQEQKPLVKLSDGKFIPPDEGAKINKKCPVQVSVEYLDDSAKSMQKVTLSLYANYKGATSNLSHYVDGYEKNGVAQAEMTMYPPPGYQEGDIVDYFFKAEHIRGEKIIDSEDITLPQETTFTVLQKGDYDENGAQKYNKEESGDNFKPNNVVKKLQGDLITTAFLPDESDDGFFGDQTDKAVREFQDYAIKPVRMKRSEGKAESADSTLDLESPDGIVEKKTCDELDKWLQNGWIKPIPTLRHGEYDDTGVDNGKGKRGADDHHEGAPVVEVQNNLQKVGVYTDGAVDGWFFDKMLCSVKDFQSAAADATFVVDGQLTQFDQKLTGYQKGEMCAATQEYLKMVVDKGGKVPPKPAIFPLKFRPLEGYHGGARNFGADRDNGRKHAGCDLIAPIGTEIMAVKDGKITLGPYEFAGQTFAMEVDHGDFMVRYTEIQDAFPAGIKVGATIQQGQVIAYVGAFHAKNGKIKHMLHFEMYSKKATGGLTRRDNPPYQRRSDLVNPTEFLDNAELLK